MLALVLALVQVQVKRQVLVRAPPLPGAPPARQWLRCLCACTCAPPPLPSQDLLSTLCPPHFPPRSSYDWGPKQADGTFKNQVKVLRLVKALESKKLRLFFDYEAMLVHASSDARAGMNKAMASNIESAAAVVVCFTETYERSKNCMRELNHADKHDKHIYYLNYMNPDTTPSKEGELAFIMSDNLWHLNRTAEEFDPEASGGGFQRLWTAMHTCPAIQALVDRDGTRLSSGGKAPAGAAAGGSS